MADKKRVLVVDDEAPIRDLLTAILEQHGFEVFAASRGSEAVKLARVRRPDAIILDIMLPDMDGAEVGGILEDDPRTTRIPVIYLTGLRSQTEAATQTDAGGHVILAKPVNAQQVLDSLARVL